MKNRRLMICFFAALCSFSITAKSSETGDQTKRDSLSVDISGDLVSRYIWRGIPLSLGANIQPFVSANYGKFSLGAWGSYSLSTPFSEADLFLSFNQGAFTFNISDYYNEDENDMSANDYLNFRCTDSTTTAHTIEGSVTFNGTDNFPLALTVATFLYGNDKDDNNRKYYSTYLEAAYSFAIKESELRLFIGGTAGEGFYSSKAAVTNVGFTASHELHISDSYSLPVYSSFIVNPDSRDVFLVFGMTF
jgi:hypothetical protein